MKAKRILVCGGRKYGYLDFKNKTPNLEEIDRVFKILDYALSVNKNLVIISGGATGADSWAIEWVNTLDEEYLDNVGLEVYPADWKKYGLSAGYIRNKKMLDQGQPDLVIAFPGGDGTKMMVDIARKAGVKVVEVKYETRIKSNTRK